MVSCLERFVVKGITIECFCVVTETNETSPVFSKIQKLHFQKMAFKSENKSKIELPVDLLVSFPFSS